MSLEAILACQPLLVVGIGNPMRGDDGAGPLLIEQLSGLPLPEGIALLDTGEVPESFLGKMISSQPKAILLVDAVDFGAKPGAIGLWEFVNEFPKSFSTHRIPLAMLKRFLEEAIGAKVVLLGIQPRSIGWGSPISPEVEQTIQALVRILTR